MIIVERSNRASSVVARLPATIIESRIPVSLVSAPHATTHSQGGSDEIDAADLGSGGAANAEVLTADGAGGASWAAASGGAGHAVWVEDEFTPTNGQITFSLSANPTDANSLAFIVNGVTYDDTTDYTRSGQTITWLDVAFVMETTDKVHARYY